jgi:segregation and condensation protein B
MEIQDIDQLVGVLESLIFVSGDPVPIKRLADVLEKEPEEIKTGLEELSKRYEESNSGIQVMEVAGGFQLRTKPIHSMYVNRFLERKKRISLSGPALETLAIIAYKQPITRAEIEVIRGVGADGVLKSLLDKRLVKVTGVKEVPGRPNLYGTTKRFLEYFGIASLKDLPPVADIADTFSSGVGIDEEEELPSKNDTNQDTIPQPETVNQSGNESTDKANAS